MKPGHEKTIRSKIAHRNTAGLRRGGPGRPKGVPNKVTREIRERYRAILEDPKFDAWLTKTLHSGRASDQIIALVHYYAYGKPRERLEVAGADGGPVVIQVVTNVPQPEGRRAD